MPGKIAIKWRALGLEKALKARPAAFYSKRAASLVTVGNIEDDLEELADVDWIIEAVIERLDIKHAAIRKLEQVLTPGTIITSNTSGLPAHMLTEGRSADFRRHFLITHFFNPVRYMRLLELVPDVDTDPALMQYMQQFATEVLGKGVVLCKDTPNFIANRIGVYGFMSTLEHALTRAIPSARWMPFLGRTWDVPNRLSSAPPTSLAWTHSLMSPITCMKMPLDDPQRETFRMPKVVREMVQRGWLGEKSGQGFYKRVKSADGASTILELNLETLEYEPQQKVRYPSLGEARNINDPLKRMLTVLNGDDRACTTGRRDNSGLADLRGEPRHRNS